MMFSTQQERAQVLQDIRDGGELKLGSSMAHASMTLGPWADRSMLRADCVSLLIGELRAAGYETPSTLYIQGQGSFSLHEAIANSNTFRVAFADARAKPELEAENLLRQAVGHELIECSHPAGKPVEDDRVAILVAEEIGLEPVR